MDEKNERKIFFGELRCNQCGIVVRKPYKQWGGVFCNEICAEFSVLNPKNQDHKAYLKRAKAPDLLQDVQKTAFSEIDGKSTKAVKPTVEQTHKTLVSPTSNSVLLAVFPIASVREPSGQTVKTPFSRRSGVGGEKR